MKYDEVHGENVAISETGNVTIHFTIEEDTDGTNHVMKNGRFVLTGEFELLGNMVFHFENLEHPGKYIVNLIEATNGITPANQIKVNVSEEYIRCRSIGDIDANDFSKMEITVEDTGTACRPDLSDASWVLYTFIACSVLAFIVIVFTLVSCFVKSVKRKTWYPKL